MMLQSRSQKLKQTGTNFQKKNVLQNTKMVKSLNENIPK